jgi:hypothetical protein
MTGHDLMRAFKNIDDRRRRIAYEIGQLENELQFLEREERPLQDSLRMAEFVRNYMDGLARD